MAPFAHILFIIDPLVFNIVLGWQLDMQGLLQVAEAVPEARPLLQPQLLRVLSLSSASVLSRLLHLKIGFIFYVRECTAANSASGCFWCPDENGSTGSCKRVRFFFDDSSSSFFHLLIHSSLEHWHLLDWQDLAAGLLQLLELLVSSLSASLNQKVV